MGMFDYLRCEYPLPVEGRMKEGEANALLFQTKDLECVMDEYTITSDGGLLGQEYDIVDRSDPNAEGLAALAGCMTRENITHIPLDQFTGEVRFYAMHGGDGWIEFSAYFQKGKLTAISLVEFKEPTA